MNLCRLIITSEQKKFLLLPCEMVGLSIETGKTSRSLKPRLGTIPTMKTTHPRTKTSRTFLLCTALLTLSAAMALAAYLYRCPRCGLTQAYQRPAIVKCPNDGWTMTPVSR